MTGDGVLTRAKIRDGVNRRRVLGVRLGSEFVIVRDRVRKDDPFVWGPLFSRSC